MMEEIFFSQMDKVRSGTIRLLEGTTEQAVDKMPEGFNNTIRWHLGHIYTIHERWVIHLADLPMQLPENFGKLFANGTKPTDWETEPPSMDNIRKLLKEQTVRIREQLSGKLYQQASRPMYGQHDVTMTEVLLRSLLHEKEHAGFIRALQKAVADRIN